MTEVGEASKANALGQRMRVQWKLVVAKFKGLIFFVIMTDSSLYAKIGYNEFLVMNNYSEKFVIANPVPVPNEMKKFRVPKFLFKQE